MQHVRLGHHRKVSHIHRQIHERHEAHGKRRRTLDRPHWIADFRQGIVGVRISNVGPEYDPSGHDKVRTENHLPDDVVYTNRERIGARVGPLPKRRPRVVVGLIVLLPDSETRYAGQAEKPRPGNQHQDNELECTERVLESQTKVKEHAVHDETKRRAQGRRDSDVDRCPLVRQGVERI